MAHESQDDISPVVLIVLHISNGVLAGKHYSRKLPTVLGNRLLRAMGIGTRLFVLDDEVFVIMGASTMLQEEWDSFSISVRLLDDKDEARLTEKKLRAHGWRLEGKKARAENIIPIGKKSALAEPLEVADFMQETLRAQREMHGYYVKMLETLRSTLKSHQRALRLIDKYTESAYLREDRRRRNRK